jgi:hypothetical protein
MAIILYDKLYIYRTEIEPTVDFILVWESLTGIISVRLLIFWADFS